MSSLLILMLGVLPIFVFAYIEQRYKPKQAVLGGLIAATIFFFFFKFYFSIEDYFGYLELALIYMMGALSLYFDKSKYFKYQPAILSFVIACVCAGMYFFLQPVFLYYLPMFEKVNPEQYQMMTSPQMLVLLDRMSWAMIPVFLFHALLMLYAASKWKTWTWAWCRVAVYPMALLAMVFAAMIRI